MRCSPTPACTAMTPRECATTSCNSCAMRKRSSAAARRDASTCSRSSASMRIRRDCMVHPASIVAENTATVVRYSANPKLGLPARSIATNAKFRNAAAVTSSLIGR